MHGFNWNNKEPLDDASSVKIENERHFIMKHQIPSFMFSK